MSNAKSLLADSREGAVALQPHIAYRPSLCMEYFTYKFDTRCYGDEVAFHMTNALAHYMDGPRLVSRAGMQAGNLLVRSNC